jgi:hypothetical protein
MDNTTEPMQCAMCTKICDTRYERCRAIRYCSKECQKADRPVHKLLCATFISRFSNAQRPDSNHIRCIYFLVDKNAPRFVWLLYTRLENNKIDVDTRGLSRVSITLEFPPQPHINESTLQRRLLGKVIISGLNLKSMPYSKILRRIHKGMIKGIIFPMLSYGKQFVNGKCGDATDLDLTDFRELVDFFES